MSIMSHIPPNVRRSLNRQALILKKNSPHIFFGLGAGAMVTSTVMACKATLKLEETVTEFKEEVEMESETATGRDMAYIYTKHTTKIIRLYGPSAMVGIGGLALLTKSHVQLTKRNAALTAAYAALHKGFDAYRERVRDEVGVEREREIYHKSQLPDPEPDPLAPFKKELDPNKASIYMKCFDETNKNWRPSPEFNRTFLRAQQLSFNDLLHARGHVFLNEVYESLGFEHTGAGSFCGWSMYGDGDKYIDFGMYDAASSRFINGDEHSIWLDFNVEGVITDLIDPPVRRTPAWGFDS